MFPQSLANLQGITSTSSIKRLQQSWRRLFTTKRTQPPEASRSRHLQKHPSASSDSPSQSSQSRRSEVWQCAGDQDQLPGEVALIASHCLGASARPIPGLRVVPVVCHLPSALCPLPGCPLRAALHNLATLTTDGRQTTSLSLVLAAGCAALRSTRARGEWDDDGGASATGRVFSFFYSQMKQAARGGRFCA